MSLSNNIDHLASVSGIEAVVVQTDHREYRGKVEWFNILDGILDLFERTDEPIIKLTCGDHAISVQKEGDEVVATVIPAGHAVNKSLRRMIRRMASKDRGPIEQNCGSAGDSTNITAPSNGDARNLTPDSGLSDG